MSELAVPKTIRWVGGPDGHVELIDQTLLPEILEILTCRDPEAVREAIVSLRIRGAPAIGVAAAMGQVLGVQGDFGGEKAAFDRAFAETRELLAGSRPTAVNLFWALDRMECCYRGHADEPVERIQEALWREALAIRDEDAQMCRSIGEHGHELVPDGAGVLTHCNAGSLATAEYGTALAVLYSAQEHGKSFKVYADETRPLLQGARLTAWELTRAGIDTTVICDNMAAQVMKEGRVQLVITGADRIAANGDVANKIGTYGLAVLAKAHGIPFYVAAPSSTFDLQIPDGTAIPIEYRGQEEVREGFGRVTAPAEANFYSPAFDVTPASLVAAIVTERGVIRPVSGQKIRAFFELSGCNAPKRY
ncbi:MAG: S-methyl-5-thioribose-1-phosphate isomerase [Phycisphaerales bacterium]|nr:MAG: S-methyl-5-thioribose-1-phosphate isomerase [Phycisphaerales bacterium]